MNGRRRAASDRAPGWPSDSAAGYNRRMEWEISKPAPHCATCEKGFAEDDELFSALYDEKTEFVRRDYCLECWTGVDGNAVFSFWRTRIPKKETPPKRFVDDQALLAFFSRLEGEEEPLKINFRFVLALLMIRKKLFRFGSVRREGEREWLILHDKREERDVEVLNPNLSDEEVEAVTEECGKLLNVRFGPPPAEEPSEGASREREDT